ncbi:uncharacterized protein LOC126800979 [Argentina anserina]|uniref:uncharacterized protein LOC126800979 n=1 Tax=Argentina anserina TaxID=57926 RepID=UPI00217635BA|nr:uncharacterized protein LOC126800979 [Potentilla anserina]
MDHIGSRESDLDFDLESGETDSGSEEDGSEESDSHGQDSKRLFRGRSGYLFIEGSKITNDAVDTRKKVSNIDETRNVIGGIEKRMGDKQKTRGSERHPKPPRPPTGPSLHAADIELVKEISKRTRLRRARRERRKALKNMKTDRSSSANINLLAIIITAVFCYVIIFQGMNKGKVHRYE